MILSLYVRTTLATVLAQCIFCPHFLFAQDLPNNQPMTAMNVWRKSITTGTGQPLAADICILQRVNGKNTVTKASIKLGSMGKYHIVYMEPKEMMGREIIADGNYFWQIDPAAHTLLKLLQVTGTGQGGRSTDPLIEQNYKITLVSQSAHHQGIPCYLLLFTPEHFGMSTQRRWIDKKTFRTVHLETRYADDVLFRDVSYSHIRSAKSFPANDFLKPNLKAYKEIDQTTEFDMLSEDKRNIEVKKMGLQSDAPFGFQVVRIAKSLIDGIPNVQIVFHDGVETISVFAQKGGRTAQVVPHGWTKIMIANDPAFRQSVGHTTTIVWSANNHRYSAISRITSENLTAFIAAQLRK